MKKIIILRHGDWNLKDDKLNESGIEKASKRKNSVPQFDLVYASPSLRTQETAELLSGKKPVVDMRAGFLKTTPEQAQIIAKLRLTHPLGVAGAIFSIPELYESSRKAGNDFLALVQEIFKKLPDNGYALIISHDGTLVAVEKILKNESFKTIEKTYNCLQGYEINENMKIEKLWF